MKTRKDYFLDCLNVIIVRAFDPRGASWSSASSSYIAEVQAEAWAIPEIAIPEDPATAAYEFFLYRWGSSKPEWLAEWEESRDAAEG